MKRFAIAVCPCVLLFGLTVACQDQAAKAELQKFKARAKVEEQNEALLNRTWETWNKGDFEAWKQIHADGYVYYSPSNSTKPMSREETIEMGKAFFKSFPDANTKVEELIAVGDKVISRWILKGTHQGEFMGIGATGNKVESSGIMITRIENGKIVKDKEDYDVLGMMTQLGMELKPKEAAAQEKESHGIAFPQSSLEQKLDRAVRNVNSRDLGGIAYAKSLGKTAADFGKVQGQLTAYLWTDIKGKGPIPFVQYWSRFVQTDISSKMEILNATKTSVEARMTVYGEKNLKSLASLGVTAEEYATYYGAMSEALADFLGLDYRQKFENGWIVFIVSEKK